MMLLLFCENTELLSQGLGIALCSFTKSVSHYSDSCAMEQSGFLGFTFRTLNNEIIYAE
jgi:hypothetical protein